MITLREWLARRRGAATTEKLIVLLFSIVLVGGALMVFGPTLMAKYKYASSMLGGQQSDTPTLADARVEREPSVDPIWYVVFAVVVTLFFIAFISPMLFPRARQTRQSMLIDLAERWPALTPLIDADARAEAGMGELRDLANEVNDLEKHKEGALHIEAQDFGRMALPAEETVDAEFFERSDLEIPTTGPHQIVPGEETTEESPGGPGGLQLGAAAGDQEETQAVAPLSQRLSKVGGDDEIPFDAVSSVDSARASSRKDPFDAPQRPGFGAIGEGSEEATISADSGGDVMAADILRESGGYGAIADDPEATIIREPGGQPPSEDETAMHQPLNRRRGAPGRFDRNADSTVNDGIRGADDPDATTKTYDTPDG